jgi:hypothetical protein
MVKAMPTSELRRRLARAQGLSPATKRWYGADLRRWEAFCRGRGLEPTDITPQRVADFIDAQAGQLSWAATARVVAAVSRAAGTDPSLTAYRVVKDAQRRFRADEKPRHVTLVW